jgi:hypothetical protein
MSDLVKINNHDVQVKEFNGQRVVTFREIDELHERPEGYARRNFYNNNERFIEGTDYHKLTPEQCVNFTHSPKGLILITESGYLMLVKSLTDDLAWQVQRQLVDTYFRVKKDPMMELIQRDPIMALRYSQIQMEERIRTNESKTQLIETRLNNLDNVNIHGDEQQKLNAMIRKYAFKNGYLFDKAWGDFKQAYNTAYRTNLEMLVNKHRERNHLKKLTIPQYLSTAGKLSEGIRVADKMLNAGQPA